MNSSKNFLVALTVLTAAASAQRSLLFTPNSLERTRSGSNGTSLEALRDNSIAVITPVSLPGTSAELFAHSSAFQTLAGDDDGDGDVFTPGFMGSIDAIGVPPWEYDSTHGFRPRQGPVTLLDAYLSPSVDVGTNVSGAPGLRRGDCGRFVRRAAGNGQVSYFIKAEQLIDVLGMVDPATGQRLNPADIDLDAIAISATRDIFVSFDADHVLRLRVGPAPGVVQSFVLRDGGVACIPAAAWTPNAIGEVGTVVSKRGMIVLHEIEVRNMLLAAQATNANGNCVTQVGDLESLAIDLDGGTFPVIWGGQGYQFPDLLFTTETLTGGGIGSTRGVGSIANVNGATLARSCGVGATDGEQMGMRATGTVGYLGALDMLPSEPCWFTVGSPSGAPLGGPIQVDVGTNIPTPIALLGFGLGTLPVSRSSSAAPWAPNSRCFPEVYNAIFGGGIFPLALAPGAGSARFASLTLANSPVVPQGILFQTLAISPGGGIELSTPLTLH